MSNGWTPDEYKLGNVSAISGVQTDYVLTKPFPITAGGSRHMVVKAVISGVTAAGTQTLKLQTSIDGVWEDSKSMAFSANGRVYIKILAEASADQTYLPLLGSGRLVLSQNNAGAAVTIESVKVLQPI